MKNKAMVVIVVSLIILFFVAVIIIETSKELGMWRYLAAWAVIVAAAGLVLGATFEEKKRIRSILEKELGEVMACLKYFQGSSPEIALSIIKERISMAQELLGRILVKI